MSFDLSPSPEIALDSPATVTEMDVCITPLLAQRSSRRANFEAENRAFQTLAQALAGDARSLLKTLTHLALPLCQADTVGISLLETLGEESVFRWVTVAGSLDSWEGDIMPFLSPCGTTVQSGQPQLYTHPERYFCYPQKPCSPIAEALLIPLIADQQALGTIWLVTHDPDRHFDLEDQRILTNLSGFTTAALTNLKARHQAEDLLQRERAARQEADLARQALDQSAKRAIDILESTTDCFVALDHDWRITYVNRTTAKLNNLSPQDMIGKTHWEMWDWSPGTIVEQNYRQAVATGLPVEFEVLYEPLQMWLEIHAYPTSEGLNLYFRNITDRKETEAKLHEQFEEIEVIYNTAPIGLAVLDCDLRFVRINSRLAQINGLSVEVHLGRSVREIVPDLADAAEPLLRHVLETGEPLLDLEINGETSAQPGVKRTWNENWFPLRDATGRVVGVNIVVEETTQRKQFEAALSESEERLRLVLTAANQGWYDLNVQTGASIVSPEYAQMLGYDPATFVETNAKWRDRLHPDDWKPVSRVYEDYIAGNRSEYRVEFRQRKQSGDWIWILSLGKIVAWDADDRPLRMLGTHTDITDRKHAEIALQEQTRLLQVIIDSIGDGLILANSNGEFVLFNQAAERIFGRLSNDRPCEDWSHTYGLYLPDRQTFFPSEQLPLYRAMRGEAVNDVEVFVRPDLTREGRWISISGFPVVDQSQEVTGGVITCRDISERKQVEAKRRQIEAELIRTNRIKDEFLAVLSHELRTPLNPILGWAKILQTGTCDAAKTQQALATIERNAKLQTQLIDDLLDVSRILRGKLTLASEPVNLTSVVEAAIETVRLAAEAKSIAIKSQLEPTLSVLGDAGRLQQVVWNLLTNAVKFTPNSGRVEIQVTQVDSTAQIQVIDTGKGIRPDFLSQVFERFQQADSSTTRQFGGLGLGLAIVRQLVELHGGTVQVSSQGEGLGATFTVWLPLIPGASSIQTVCNRAIFTSLQGLRVLVVDDEADARELVQFVLEQEGAIVTSVSSGRAALKSLKQDTFNVIISDIGMPDMDGYGLIEQIRSDLPTSRQILAIALSAYAGEANERQILKAGFQKHLAKPVDPIELVTLVRQLISLRSASAL
ncbi:PAS domain-containing protein [Phormidesmis sp. 146-12]